MHSARTLTPPAEGAGAGLGSRGPLSLAFYSPSWPPGLDSNGVVPYVGTLKPELEAQGHAVSVVSWSVARGAAGVGIYDLARHHADRRLPDRVLDRFARLRGREQVLARAACRMIAAATRQAIAERGTQLLEMEETFGWGWAVRRKVPIPLVIRLHGPWFLNGPANGCPADGSFRARVRREGLAICEADGITAPSLDVLERTRSYYGLALEHAVVIPPPLPTISESTRWNPQDCDPGLILFIGRFDLHKGGDIIIDAFQRVVERVPQARLRFVGLDRGIPRGDGRGWTIRSYADERVPGAWDARRLEWLGQQPRPALEGLRRRAAVTVVCSRYETFGLTATEAMLQGCPLVVTAAGALREIVQDGINGLVCRPADPEDLAEKLCLLLGNLPYAERLGRQAALDCRRRYDPGLLAAQSADYYRSVIARTRTTPSGAREIP